MTDITDLVPRPLLDDIVAGKAIPIIGAGFSRNAVLPEGEQMPLWEDVGRKIADLIPNYPYSTPIDALSAFEHEFTRGKLVEELSRILRVEESEPGAVHKTFCQCPFDVVCTTNFDFLVERAYGQQAHRVNCRPVMDQEQFAVPPSSRSVQLIKLHGDLNHPNRLIMTEDDYDTFTDRYPIVATYLGHLLLTRTPLFIGYSLEDPDFRQIWRVIANRLGRMRRAAYVIDVGMQAWDQARYERRGVKVVNLPGDRNKRGPALEAFFSKLLAVWMSGVAGASASTTQAPELAMPEGTTTRLCYFAIPARLHAFYRSYVFPIAERCGLSPLTAIEAVQPGDNVLATIMALLSRAQVVVADIAGSFDSLMEVSFAALRRPLRPKILIVMETGAAMPSHLRGLRHIERPPLDAHSRAKASRVGGPLLDEFLESVRAWLERVSNELRPDLREEPMRLLRMGEYRAAIISVVSLLEVKVMQLISAMGEELTVRKSIHRGLKLLAERELLNRSDVDACVRAWAERSLLIHTSKPTSAQRAKSIVGQVLDVIGKMDAFRIANDGS